MVWPLISMSPARWLGRAMAALAVAAFAALFARRLAAGANRGFGAGTLVGRQIRQTRVLRQLQRAHVGGDRPAIRHRDLARVTGHGAEAVRDDVEEIARRR